MKRSPARTHTYPVSRRVSQPAACEHRQHIWAYHGNRLTEDEVCAIAALFRVTPGELAQTAQRTYRTPGELVAMREVSVTPPQWVRLS